MIYVYTVSADLQDGNGPGWVDGQLGTLERIGFLMAQMDEDATLTVTIRQGIVVDGERIDA